jgi:histidinol-phosphate aminotransferase
MTDPFVTGHGGPDALGAVAFDFSTNANSCGPCPQALRAVQAAQAACYPDPAYTLFRAQLAQFHGVELSRVLVATSASEFIYRMTLWAVKLGLTEVIFPAHSYADYADAAGVLGLRTATQASTRSLAWHCDPSSPLGQTDGTLATSLANGALVVLDRAYEPLRLRGVGSATDQQLDQVWQLWSPNKALGLTGVRADYAIAPAGDALACRELTALCASWPVGAHGVAMLTAWVQPEVQEWVADSHVTLRAWKARQLAMCAQTGWDSLASETNFFCAKPSPLLPINQLRSAGIKLRDCSTFRLPGYFRLSVQPPVAQNALYVALKGC